MTSTCSILCLLVVLCVLPKYACSACSLTSAAPCMLCCHNMLWNLIHWWTRAATLGESATLKAKASLWKTLAIVDSSVSDSISFISPVTVFFPWRYHWIQNRLLCLLASELLLFGHQFLVESFYILHINYHPSYLYDTNSNMFFLLHKNRSTKDVGKSPRWIAPSQGSIT